MKLYRMVTEVYLCEEEYLDVKKMIENGEYKRQMDEEGKAYIKSATIEEMKDDSKAKSKI